jgi:hypothetical protein
MPSLLAKDCLIEDLDLDQWKRLAALAMAHWKQRRLYVVHQAGTLVRAYDTVKGEQPLPAEALGDAQALAERLLAERAAEGVAAVWVLDLEAYHGAIGAVERGLDTGQGIDAYLGAEWLARFKEGACAYAPKGDFLFYGLPWERLTRFAQRMLPPSCTFVLGVFDGDALWATCFAQIQGGVIVGLSTSAALDPDDVKDVVGRDQHPFLLATVANRYRRPAFGWFCQREDFEAYMTANTVDAKDAVFQTALMKGRATFDFNILIDRGITPLAPMNPGEQAVAGVDREANPRTQTPDPNDPGPSAF